MTTRRILAFVAVALAVSVGTATAAKKQKTGVIENNVYRDNLYGFRFEAIDNWKFDKPKKEKPDDPRRERFRLIQKNYQVPSERRDNQEDYTPPGLGLWVDTTSLPVDSFAAQIANPKSKLKARKEIMRVFSDLQSSSYKFENQTRIQIDGADGVVQNYRVDYEVQLYDRVRDRYRILEEILLGDLYIVKNRGRVYVFFYRAERPNYRHVKVEITKMIQSMSFNPEADTTAGSGG